VLVLVGQDGNALQREMHQPLQTRPCPFGLHSRITRCLTNSTSCVESIFNILLKNILYHVTPSLSIVKLGPTIHGQDTIKLGPDKFAIPPSEDYPSTTIDSTTLSEYHHPSTLRQGLLQRISRTNIIPQPQIIDAAYSDDLERILTVGGRKICFTPSEAETSQLSM